MSALERKRSDPLTFSFPHPLGHNKQKPIPTNDEHIFCSDLAHTCYNSYRLHVGVGVASGTISPRIYYLIVLQFIFTSRQYSILDFNPSPASHFNFLRYLITRRRYRWTLDLHFGCILGDGFQKSVGRDHCYTPVYILGRLVECGVRYPCMDNGTRGMPG